MKVVKILGGGCSNCDILAKNTQEAADKLGQEIQLIKVTDFSEIAEYDVMATPALVVDEKVLSTGKVIKSSLIEGLLKS